MLDLDSYLPYLLNRAGSRIADAFEEVLRPHRISLMMWRALAALNHRDGQRMGQLAALTSIEVSTLSRVVGALERRGWAERRRPEPNAADARAVTVHLTESGRALTEQLIPTAALYERISLDGFSEREIASLKSMLLRLYENTGRIDAQAGGRREGPLAAE